MSHLSLNNCTGGKGSGPVFEALQVTLGNIHSLKGNTPPGITTYDIWEQGIRDAMTAAMRPRWELLQPSGNRFKVVGELPADQGDLARRIVAAMAVCDGWSTEFLEAMLINEIPVTLNSDEMVAQLVDANECLRTINEDLARRLVEAEARIARGPVQAELFS